MKKYAIGMDVGGSHISAALVDIEKHLIVQDSKVKIHLDSQENAEKVLAVWEKCIQDCLDQTSTDQIEGIGISMPGPANYEQGISHMYGGTKYEKLFGLNIRNYLYRKFSGYLDDANGIQFINDASGFLLGEAWRRNLEDERIMGITLGTGIGSGFMIDGRIVQNHPDVPPEGEVFDLPFQGRTAEDWISTRWFLGAYKERTGSEAKNVKEIADLAVADEGVKLIFDDFGNQLGGFLKDVLNRFKASSLVIGGNVSKSFPLFRKNFEAHFGERLPALHFAHDTETAAILGSVKNLISRQMSPHEKRKTSQPVMPQRNELATEDSTYDLYPTFEIEKGEISLGYDSLAKEISTCNVVCIEGYTGVFYEEFLDELCLSLGRLGIETYCYDIRSTLHAADKNQKQIQPFLGGDDPVFGKIYKGDLGDFFDAPKLGQIQFEPKGLSIIYGCGASLKAKGDKLIYLDVPKNEIQFRSRAGFDTTLIKMGERTPKQQYKQMFFVDWPVLNRHKQELLKMIDCFVDTQFITDISWCNNDTLLSGLQAISSNAFRVRPWFEPGAWGGDWCLHHIPALNKNVPNYAWSFELIVPENGIVLSHGDLRCELSFDCLMYYDQQAVLGEAAEVFGVDFPIRFDFLDTFNGGNLSLQCHPKPEFIQEQFGESFTQDETYYMLDADKDAKVYLGFQENIQKDDFRKALETSRDQGTEISVEDYVQVHEAKKHDLFLIPHGTIHCSGKNGLVLEISSTPYIYTFKLYDWLRLDLDGQPRPLNIERGMENLNFDCKGDRVKADYISEPVLVSENEGNKLFSLPTHKKHFYEVFRYEFTDKIQVSNHGACHILSLVEGDQIQVQTGNRRMDFHYAETFVIPAGAKEYTIVNTGKKEAKVIRANVKANWEFKQ